MKRRKNVYLVKKRHQQEEWLEQVSGFFKTLGKITMVLVIGSLIVSASWVVKNFLLVTPYFNVKDIMVEGNETVSKNKILEIADIKKDQNIFKLDLVKIQYRVKQDPLFEEVYIKRNLPDTIRINVKERKALALLNLEGYLYKVDKKGIIFQKLPLATSFNLPIINYTGLKDVVLGNKNRSTTLEVGLKLLEDLMISNPLLLSDISEINLKSLDEIIIYTNQGIKLKAKQDLERYKWNYIYSVINAANDRKIKIDFLDLRYYEQIVLKPRV